MAQLVKPTIGNYKGKIGNLTARTRYGKTILFARPVTFNASNNPKDIAIRNRFRVTSKLASFINRFPDLKKIWSKNSPAGIAPYNIMIRENLKFSQSDRPTINNILTPANGFGLNITSTAISGKEATVNLPPLNTFKTFARQEKGLSAYMLLIPFNPADDHEAYFNIINLNYFEVNYDNAIPLRFTIALTQLQGNMMDLYNHSILLMCLATKNAEGSILEYSKTYAQVNK